MTKTLTEQWREGKLPEDTYYVRFICGRYGVYEFEQFKGFGFDNDFAYIKEVVATVPSYDEFVQQRDFVKDHQKVLIENMNLKLKIERLEKQLAKTKTKEYIVKVDWFSPDPVGFLSEKQTQKMFGNWKKKKEAK